VTVTTYTLRDERERLDERLDELADRAADADEGAGERAVMQVAREVEIRLQGVQHLINEYGADGTVTVKALTAGDTAEIEDRAAGYRTQTDHTGGVPGARRNLTAASGLQDAPFLDDPDDFDDRLAAVSEQPTGVVKWLRARAEDLASVDEGNVQSFDERLAARSSET